MMCFELADQRGPQRGGAGAGGGWPVKGGHDESAAAGMAMAARFWPGLGAAELGTAWRRQRARRGRLWREGSRRGGELWPEGERWRGSAALLARGGRKG